MLDIFGQGRIYN